MGGRERGAVRGATHRVGAIAPAPPGVGARRGEQQGCPAFESREAAAAGGFQARSTGLRNFPVNDPLARAICSGVPFATTSPPSSPPSGPRSRM
jgi:hypothetical protein